MTDSNQGFRVLVVDDEPGILLLVRRILESSYRLTTVSTIADAHRALEDDSYELVLSDQRLPDGAGTALLARVAEEYPLTKRVIMSGNLEPADLLSAINVARVSRFIQKPFRNAQLLAAIEECLRDYSREREYMVQMILDHTQGSDASAPRIPKEKASERRRPPTWPRLPSLGMAEGSPVALAALLEPDLAVALSIFRPADDLDVEKDLPLWSAELERRLVTTLRATDQAIRIRDGCFLAAFSSTSDEGRKLACERLAAGLEGGLRVENIRWPAQPSQDRYEFAEEVFKRAAK